MNARPISPTRLGPNRFNRNAEGNAVTIAATAITDMSQPASPGLPGKKSSMSAGMNVGTLYWFMMAMMPQNSIANRTIQPLR